MTRVLKTRQPLTREQTGIAKLEVEIFLNEQEEGQPWVTEVVKAYQPKATDTGLVCQETLFELVLTTRGSEQLAPPTGGYSIRGDKNTSFSLEAGPHCIVCHSTNHGKDACPWTLPEVKLKLLGDKNAWWNLTFGGHKSKFDDDKKADEGTSTGTEGQSRKRPKLNQAEKTAKAG